MTTLQNSKILDVEEISLGDKIIGFIDVPNSFLNLTMKGVDFLKKYGFYNIPVMRNGKRITLNAEELIPGDQLLTMGSLQNTIKVDSLEHVQMLFKQGFRRVKIISGEEASTNQIPGGKKQTSEKVRENIFHMQESVEKSRAVVSKGTELIGNLFEQGNPQHSDLSGIEEISEEINGLITNNSSAINALSFLEEHDDYTFRHCVDVANQTLIALTYLNKIKPTLSPEEMKDIGVGTLLHDIGKSKIPRSLINKPGKLTDQEWVYMRMHPAYSAKIMSDMHLSRTNIEIGYYHHVLKDGSGYPKIKYDKVNMPARMCTLADVFQALTTKRPYRKTDPPAIALKKIKIWSTDQFDEYLTNIFIKSFGVYPPGSLIELSDHRIGFVFINSGESSRPVISIVIDKDGNRIQNKEIIDLKNPEFSSLEVLRGLPVNQYFKSNEATDLFLSITP